MSEKDNQLSAFMKKQISEKATKKVVLTTNNSTNLPVESKKKDVAEMDEEEQLEEAKKLSRSKAAQSDQTEMLKKLFFEKAAKYILVVAFFAIFAIAIIKSGPVIAGFFNGLISRIILGGIS